jgi:hypothetical protein
MTFFAYKKEGDAVMCIKKILMLILMIPAITALLSIPSNAEAGASCSFVTVPKHITYLDGWNSSPKIYTSSDTVAPSESVNAWAMSSGWPCPPYSWSVAEAGYTITPTTNNDTDLATLTAPAGSCGIATVTVTDACGFTDTYKIRNTNGTWKWKDVICGSMCARDFCYGAPIENIRYVLTRAIIYPAYFNGCESIVNNGAAYGLPTIIQYDAECGNARPRVRVNAPPDSSGAGCLGAPCQYVSICGVQKQEWECP